MHVPWNKKKYARCLQNFAMRTRFHDVKYEWLECLFIIEVANWLQFQCWPHVGLTSTLY